MPREPRDPLERFRRRDLLAGATGLALAAPLSSLLVPRGARAQTAAPTVAPAPTSGLIELTRRPLNYESPVDVFATRITPIERFYVRNHFDVPLMDRAKWRLQITGLVDEPLTLGLADLEAMPQVTLEAVLQCAGNGRALFQPRMPGVQWRKGAMGNARWTGVRLADVLKRARPRAEAHYLEMQGAESPSVATTPPFIRAVKVDKALHPDTLIALKMNDVPLPAVHGGPARLVMPGWVADDWTKWVSRLELRADEPKAFFYAKGYRYPETPGAPGAPVDKMVPMERLVVKSVLAAPLDGAVLPVGRHEVKGVAFSGEAKIDKVEVSVDGGASWQKAALEDGGTYGFTVFSLPFDAKPGRVTILARATDARGAVQPEAPVWNPSGYLYNAIDRAVVEVRA